MAQSRTLSVGMDVHKESSAVASGTPADGADVVSLGTVGPRPGDSDKLLRRRQATRQPLGVVSAAGPCGAWLYRSLTKTGYPCWVVAPAWMPKKTGDRVTTDRRAAMQLARRRRSGALTPVSGPAVDDAAIRDLRRAREDTLRELKAAKLRLKAFVLRHASRYTGRANWRAAPLRWRSDVVCPTPAQQRVFQASVQTVTAQTARLGRLARTRHAQGTTWRCAPVVEALQALRGVPCTVAVTTVAALGDLTRGENPRQLLHALGLPPSEDSSGARRQPGSMTTTGNTQARRALVAGAWASRDPATVSRHLQRRLAKRPAALQAISGKAPVRLCKRSRQLIATGKKAHQVVVAMARELVGCMWAMATQVPVPPQA